MTTLGVVEHPDVVQHSSSSFVTCEVDPALDPLSLKQLEKSASDRVVAAVATPVRATDDAISLQEGLLLN